MGGGSDDKGYAIASDVNGAVVVTGETSSTDFPVTMSSSLSSTTDAFVMKFDGSGTRLWATYYGGNALDYGHGVNTHGPDHIIVSGETNSTNFPVTNGSIHAGSTDAFIAVFNGTGTVQWASYYGGSGSDWNGMVATDSNGDISIAGATGSSDLPVTNSSTYAGGAWDAFVVKFTISGVVQWATYFGGNGSDVAAAICTDGYGNVIITGDTKSSNLPVTNSSIYKSGWDAFAAKFDGNGSTQRVSYYGGSGDDAGRGVCTDGNTDFAITGYTKSTDFPATNSTMLQGSDDAFLIKCLSDLSVQWGTYIGGNGADYGAGINVDGSGDIYATGSTTSTNFPVTNSSTLAGQSDAYIIIYSSSGSRLGATYFGGSGWDESNAIASDGAGNLFISGTTYSTDLPVTNFSSNAGAADVFIASYAVNAIFPVEMISFTAIRNMRSVVLDWHTASESNNCGFELQRSITRIDRKWDTRGFIPGGGSTTTERGYQFVDDLPPGDVSGYSIFYRLKQIDFDGSAQYSSVIEVFPGPPGERMVLSPPFPQPATHEAVLGFSLPGEDETSISLYDVLGRKVALLLAPTVFNTGRHTVRVHWTYVAPGEYFLRVQGTRVTATQRFVIR